MRLFHVSEESDIECFRPRVLERRKDIDQGKGLVWAVREEKLYNFMFPRECPRISTFKNDKHSFNEIEFDQFLVAVEEGWIERIKNCRLYVYEFATENFELQDAIAGYYVSREVEKPIKRMVIEDCFKALADRNVKVLTLDTLWQLRDQIYKSTTNFSFCKMVNAIPR